MTEANREVSDESLAERARSGDRGAAAALVGRLYPGVLTLCRRMLPDPDLARDATQEAFHRALAALGTFDGHHRFSAWIFRIAANLVRDRLRRPGRVSTADLEPDDWPSDAPPPEDAVIREEEAGLLKRELLSLPEETRLALLLHFQEGLKGPEIAYALGITHQAARLRICRGIAKLRARMVEPA